MLGSRRVGLSLIGYGSTVRVTYQVSYLRDTLAALSGTQRLSEKSSIDATRHYVGLPRASYCRGPSSHLGRRLDA